MQTIDTKSTALIEAATIAQADRLLNDGPIDVALVSDRLPDGSGVEFAARLQRTHGNAQSIIITDDRSVTTAVASIRAGVTDLMTKPLDTNELAKRFAAATKRNRAGRKKDKQLKRLRRLCQKLNQARVDVTRQVDIL